MGAVLENPRLTCAGVARHICLNAARLPDVIRRDPEFRNILRPWTRHDIAQKQALQSAPSGPEPPPKLRAMQLLGTFLLSEPAYRGDASKDPVTAELLALCQKIAKDDPVFVLKLAHYVRHTLTFRNTTNFLLATAVQIEPCRPFVRAALPACTNLPTDLLELWDFWRKLSGGIALPASLKKGMADKFDEFGEYQLGKYLNAKVPKPAQAAPAAGKKGKGRGKGGVDAKDPKDAEKVAEEAEAKKNDPLTRPLTLKTLIRAVHAGQKNPEAVCGVLRKRYPMTEEEFKEMNLDLGGSKAFDPERMGEKLRIPVPKTWETELSEKGNTKEVWQDLVQSKNLPFMAMLRNLRNIIMAGVDQKTHKAILGRLTCKQQVANSKQMPVRFLSAFEAIDFSDETLAKLAQEATSQEDFIVEQKAVGSGKEAKKIEKKRPVCRNPPTRALLDQYRNALETAVSLAAQNNVPPLECSAGGKAVVLVDVSGSMESPLTQGPKKLHESAMTPHRRSGGRPIVEGQDMDLEDYFSQAGQRLSKKISVSMTWIGQDLDLSVMVLDKEGNQVVSVSYSNTSWEVIQHSGDITNAPYGAEEVISVDLEKLPENAFMLFFTINSYSGQVFDQLPEAAISLRDDGLEGNSVEGTQEICAFRLTGTHKALIACGLIRKERGWSFRCLNTPQAQGMTVQSLLGKIRKEYEAAMADAATQQKRLIDAALLLALCLRERMGDDKCEVVLFSSPGKEGGPGYKVLRGLGPKVLANIRRCHDVAKQLGRGTELPIGYLQELSAAGVALDHLVLLTDGLVAPAKNPAEALSRWLASHRARVQPVRFACIDVLGLGKPCIGDGSSDQDVLISGYSEATLRYLTQEPGAQLAEVEAIKLPSAKGKSEAGPEQPKEEGKA
uniref:TROVE domain-containing protein n=2 Tax=Pyrodinium bahamense TaxID=73915 RepID=A0A7R9ZVK8_9DINO